MNIRKRARFTVMIIFVLIQTSLLIAQSKKVLTLEDYPRWRRITSTSISPDGNWITYGYRPNNADDTLHVMKLSGNSPQKIPGGTRPVFSGDSRWAAYMINLPKAEAEKLRKAKKPVTREVELRKLGSDEKFTEKGAQSFTFSEDSKFFVLKKAKSDKDAKHDGTDIILRNLETGTIQNIGNVGSFAFNKKSDIMVYTIDADNKTGNGVYMIELETNRFVTLDNGSFDYSRLTWDEEGTTFAVLKGDKKEKMTQKDNILLIFTKFGKGAPEKIVYNPADDAGFPENMVLSDKGSLSWNDDHTLLFLGIKEQEKEPEKSEDPVANVDVWHWKDEQIQSVQMRQANRNRNFTYRSVFNLGSRKFARLTDENMRSISLTRDGKWGIGRNDKPYISDTQWGGTPSDYYRVNTETGERKKFVEKMGRAMGISPDSRHYLYLKDEQIWVYDIKSDKITNISESAPVGFVNVDDDHPYEKPAFGLAGWTKDGKGVILNHRFDLWRLELNGRKAVNITDGMGDKEQIRFRYVRLDREERFIDTKKPILLAAYGEWTKKSGYYRLKTGKTPEKVIFVDKSIGRLTKAKKADKIMYTMGTFEDFHNYYVSNTNFDNPKMVTDANPHQDEYAWGRRVLVDYENSRGVKLQATLTLPAGYREGQKYPMLVYFYEKVSQRHHQYSSPVYDDRPHMSTYASDGYLVLMPDIVYTTGTPGTNALDCVTSAVKKVIDLGYADPDHIGMQGHSWGGYETSFMVTQTDMFACVVTGAPPTNLITFYNTHYKSSGRNQQGIMETGQVRMGTDPWSDPELYRSQSPIHQAENITTPFMILHGIEDGSVDYSEGLAYYNAARRLGKEVILLSYPGEGHHLSKIENQKDFQVRMKQYFDHYLKGESAPDWMVNGIPFLKKKSK